jgi:alpha-D-xyloside xylohydrolase
MFLEKQDSLVYRYGDETVCIESWGPNALRVRATRSAAFTGHAWALDPAHSRVGEHTGIEICRDQRTGKNYLNMRDGQNGSYGIIRNGEISARINGEGVITFQNAQGRVLLKEFWRRLQDETSMALNIPGREYRHLEGENYAVSVRFVPADGEKIFGMGQYQQHQFDLKGCVLELAQRNSQVSVPFFLSSLGYGFLWNNPAVGKVMFGTNETEWHADTTKEIDYVVIAGAAPAAIEQTYMDLVGHAPDMPEYGLGFWQCKLRYRTQEELLAVARRHKALGLPMDVIVADFFHWTQQGEYKFDPVCWPDVPAMCRELDSLGIKLMVSVWPTVDTRSENYAEMLEKGYLVRTNRGVPVTMTCMGDEVFFDATNPEARAYVWQKCKQNYYDQGARLFWLDVAEPEYTTYQFDNYRYQLGTTAEVGNIYPRMYTQGFYDGLTAAGDARPISLVRSAWAGSARYGALVWSGDIVSSFECFNRQVRAGLSMAVAGIPWWTTDIGGFHGGATADPEFHKLFVRWFQYGCFCPVFRLHGNRNPGSGYENGCGTGADNEVWSYSPEVFEICKKYLLLREKLRPYLREQMHLVHTTGLPMMRPLFFDYPADARAWAVEDSYLFGPDLLVAPVLEKDSFQRNVYLPAGTDWVNAWTHTVHPGGTGLMVEAPLAQIPLFIRCGSPLEALFAKT